MDMTFADSFLLKGVDSKGAILNFPEELEKAVAFGRDIAMGLR
jgi:hypothetical protein